MARAKRHYLPGQIWHLTHRCHKKEFLLKLSRDRRRLLQWLYESRKRYGLVILNYSVTSNHVHFLVFDEKGANVIPDSVKLVAGRIGQEYNIRKKRKGAFWEDRYHATAIESGQHLLRCLVYIDLNMVRAKVVNHPSQWPFCGYNEIRKPRRKNVLIAYPKLAQLAGFKSYEEFSTEYNKYIHESLSYDNNARQSKWSESIAVGSKSFVRSIKEELGILAQGRKILETGDDYELREAIGIYEAEIDSKKEHIGVQNRQFWDINYKISSS